MKVQAHKAGEVGAEVVFDGIDSTASNWLVASRLLDSTYDDLYPQSPNILYIGWYPNGVVA